MCYRFCWNMTYKSRVILLYYRFFFFFFKQKTAYEMRISDWSSDVCSSDLAIGANVDVGRLPQDVLRQDLADHRRQLEAVARKAIGDVQPKIGRASCRERVCQYV